MSVKAKAAAVAIAFVVLSGLGATAAERPESASADAAFVATKAAAIETLRARLAANPSVAAGAILMEADDLLRRYQQAAPAQKTALRSQLDSALIRAELDLAQPR